MGERKQINALIEAIDKYSGFRQMAEYNISCLLTYIKPPTVGWRENVASAVKYNAIEHIINALGNHSNAPDMVKLATVSLAGLTTSKENAGKVAAQGGIETALNCMLKLNVPDRDRDEVMNAGSDLIERVARFNPESIIARPNAIKAMLSGLSHETSPRVQEASAKVLDRVGIMDAGLQVIVKSGGIQGIIHAIAPGKETKESMLTPLFRLLERMAKDSTLLGHIRAAGGVEAIVAQLEQHSDNEYILRAGGRLLAKLAAGDIQNTIIQIGSNLPEASIQHLVALLANLALQPENVEQIVAHGGIEALLKNFNRFNQPAKISALRAFERIGATSAAHAKKIIDLGGIDTIVNALRQALKTGDEEMMKAATQALTSLVSAGLDSAQMVHNGGGIKAVLDGMRMHPNSPEFIESGLEFIEKLGAVDFDRGVLLNLGAVDAILGGMGSNPDNAAVQQRGFDALLTLVNTVDQAQNKAAAKAIENNAGIPQLAKALFQHSANNNVVRSGVNALAKLVTADAEAGKVLESIGTIDALVEAVFTQLRLEMLGKSKLSFDTNYTRNVKTLLSKLVSPNAVKGAARNLKGGDASAKQYLLKRLAVFALNPEFASIQTGDSIGKALVQSLQSSLAGLTELLPTHAVAIWSNAKASLEGLTQLYEANAVGTLFSVVKAKSKNTPVAVAGLRSVMIFAANGDLKDAIVSAGGVESAVACMRSNEPSPEAQLAGIDLMISLASVESGSSAALYKGGVRQVNKMIADSSMSVDYEKAIERGLRMVYLVANLNKSDVKPAMKKLDTINMVTLAMSSFPGNSTITEYGGRILSLLMDEADVAHAIDEVATYTKELQPSRRPDTVFPKLGQKVATVGFLAINPKNREVIARKQAEGVTNNALVVSKGKEKTPVREIAVRNELRALGQIASAVPTSASNAVDTLLKNLFAREEDTGLLEKTGALEGIKFLSSRPEALIKLQSSGALDAGVDLLNRNRSDEDLVFSALDALHALMGNSQGIDIASRNGARDAIFGVLKDDADSVTPRVAEAAMTALSKLAKRKPNMDALVEDGVIDIVTTTLGQQLERGEEAQPRVLGAAADLLNELAKDDSNADTMVKNGAVEKVIDIANSSPEYLLDGDCLKGIAGLLNTLSDVDGLREKLRDMGAVDLIMRALNLNPHNEGVQSLGQGALQKLVGGDAAALENALKDYDRLLAAVSRRPNDQNGLDRLNRGGINLGNLLIVPGVVDADGAQNIAKRAIDTYKTVDKKVSPKVGPVRDEIMETALQNLGRSAMIDGAMAQIDQSDALDALLKAMENRGMPQVQIQALDALGKMFNQDPKFLEHAVLNGVIDKISQVSKMAASPAVKDAADGALEQIRQGIANNPVALLSLGKQGDKALGEILRAIDDPKDLDDLLQRLLQTPGGADALLRLGLDNSLGLPDELRRDILRNLAMPKDSDQLVNIPPHLLADILKRLRMPKTDPEEKRVLLDLLGKTALKPEMTKVILDKGAVDALLEMLQDKHTDPAVLRSALDALGEMSKNPMLAQRIAALNGANALVDIMKKFEDEPKIQEKGFAALGNLASAAGGPENLQLTPVNLDFLQGAIGKLEGPGQEKAQELLDALSKLYGGELEPMVVQRFNNMLEMLKGGKDWVELLDPKTGRPYYYNKITKETTWQKPAALIAAEQALEGLRQLAEQAPAEIDPAKLRAALGHFESHTDTPLRLKALAKALAALAANEKNRDAMVRHGMLDALISAMNSKNVDREFILAAIALLNQFAKHKVFKEQICRLGGIRALIAIMRKYMDDEEIIEKAEQCLANLAFESRLCVDEIIVCDGPKVVLLALDTHSKSQNVIVNAMILLCNIMFKSEDNKLLVGNLFREKFIRFLRGFYKNPDVFYQTTRCIGNIAFIDDHIRFCVRHGVVKSLISAMNHHSDKVKLTKLGIDVLSNLAQADDEKYAEFIKQGRMVSVISTIWHEGGAKKVVDTFGESNDSDVVGSCVKCLMLLFDDSDVRKKLVGMGVVRMILDAMQKYESEEEISEFFISALEVLSISEEGSSALFEEGGVSKLLQFMETNDTNHDYLLGVTKTFLNMSNNRSIGPRVLTEIASMGGIDTMINTLDVNAEDSAFCKAGMSLLTKMIAVHKEKYSVEIAKTGMRAILQAAKIHLGSDGKYNGDSSVLVSAYQLIGLMAFQEENLRVIVQFGGIDLIIESILRFPDKPDLVKRSIQTLDNIAMASEEHGNIVENAGGKNVIQELINTYSTIPDPYAKEIVEKCKAALLSLNKIQMRPAKPRYIFTETNQDDPSRDPLKEYRHLLKSGTIVTYWTGRSKKKLLFVDKEWQHIVLSRPDNKNKQTKKFHLRNIATVEAKIVKGHGRKARPECCLALGLNDGSFVALETDLPDQKTRLYEALEALRKTFRNNKRWLV